MGKKFIVEWRQCWAEGGYEEVIAESAKEAEEAVEAKFGLESLEVSSRSFSHGIILATEIASKKIEIGIAYKNGMWGTKIMRFPQRYSDSDIVKNALRRLPDHVVGAWIVEGE